MAFRLYMSISCLIVSSFFCPIKANSVYVDYSGLALEEPFTKLSSPALTLDQVIKGIIEDQKPVERLNLSSNPKLTDKSIRYLVKKIREDENKKLFENLQFLNLAGTGVTANIVRICRHLLKRKEFKFLDLQSTPPTFDENFPLHHMITKNFPQFNSKIIRVEKYLLRYLKKPDEDNVLESHEEYYNSDYYLTPLAEAKAARQRRDNNPLRKKILAKQDEEKYTFNTPSAPSRKRKHTSFNRKQPASKKSSSSEE